MVLSDWYQCPRGERLVLQTAPRLASWNKATHPDQVSLREYLQHAESLVIPARPVSGPRALWLDVAVLDDRNLRGAADLDNYALPLATRVQDHRLVSVWVSKGHGLESSIVAAPAVLRSDNGPEFISEAMADWAGTRTGLSYIPPGSPWRNGYVESFNSRIRDECLNINSFYSLLHAQVVIGDWKDEYNHHRRHSSLGYLPPAEYAQQCTHQIETDDSQSVRTE